LQIKVQDINNEKVPNPSSAETNDYDISASQHTSNEHESSMNTKQQLTSYHNEMTLLCFTKHQHYQYSMH